MNTPSLPMILFTLADAFARGGMPEPAEVRVDADRGLVLGFAADEAAARRWAVAIGLDLTNRYEWSTQPFTAGPGTPDEGQQFTLINGYGTWQGLRVRLSALVPVDEAAAVTS